MFQCSITNSCMSGVKKGLIRQLTITVYVVLGLRAF